MAYLQWYTTYQETAPGRWCWGPSASLRLAASPWHETQQTPPSQRLPCRGVTTVSKTMLPLQRGTQPIQGKVSKCVKHQTFFWIPWILRDYEHQSRSLCISCRANESLSFCADGLWFKIRGPEKSIPFVPSERFIISISRFSGGRFNVEVHEFRWRIMMWLCEESIFPKASGSCARPPGGTGCAQTGTWQVLKQQTFAARQVPLSSWNVWEASWTSWTSAMLATGSLLSLL